MNIISKEEFEQTIKEKESFLVTRPNPTTIAFNGFMEFTTESNILNDLYDICYPKKHKRIPYKYGKHSYRKEVK